MAENQNEDIKLDAEPGKGAAGNQQAVQVAQSVGKAVQPPGTKEMQGGNPEQAESDIESAEQSESDSDMSTTDGYVVDDSGRLNNFAIEPEMYIEEK